MARISFGLTLSIGGAALWLALDELSYLAPYGRELMAAHGPVIVLFVVALGFDLFALLYGICRRLGLGDAGRKLRRLEGEVHRGVAFDDELGERLRRQKESGE